MRKIIYFVIILLFLATSFLSYRIISGEYDKQDILILKIKDIVPTKLQNKLRNYVYDLRKKLNKERIEEIQKAKLEQGLKGKLIQSKTIKTETDKIRYFLREYFLPFERLDLSYGWRAIQNAKRAHYLDVIDDKIIVVSGKGEFIYFETKNLLLEKLNQNIIENNLVSFIEKENFKFIGLRDLLIDKEVLYVSVILQDIKGNYTLSILSSNLNLKKLKFNFFYKLDLNIPRFSIGSGGRIVSFDDNKLLLTIGHFDFIDEIQNSDHLAGKIISINKDNKNFDIVSLGHRNAQGLFFFEDNKDNQFIINSEHGPKGGDEVNINHLKNNRVPNFGWPIASYGVNYDGTNPYKSSHKNYGFDEPFVNFTPSIGISEISVIQKKNFKTIYVSSLRANSIYIVNSNENFSKIISSDRLKLGNRIRDLKYVKSLNGFIVILESTPSIGFLKIKD